MNNEDYHAKTELTKYMNRNDRTDCTSVQSSRSVLFSINIQDSSIISYKKKKNADRTELKKKIVFNVSIYKKICFPQM